MPPTGSSEPLRPACNAPTTSLHLDPSGNVRVCELNSMAMLGTVATDRLEDLWRGRRIGRIRDAVARHDLSLGCEGCAPWLAEGRRDAAHAAYYDRFEPSDDWPRQLELSLSNACNLQCVMCNGDLSSAIRTHREGLPPLPAVYDERFFADLDRFLPHLERVTFIGGEPFLGRESLRVLDRLIELGLRPEVQVTTNGMVLTPRVERYLDALPLELTVSLDAASAATYEQVRIGGDWDRVLRHLDAFVGRARSVALSYCLMTVNWREFGAFLRLASDRGLYGHVNVVTAPRRFSLYHLPAEQLAAVCLALDEEDPGLGAEDPNRAVWDAQRARLRAHLEHLDEAAPTPATPVELSAEDPAALAASFADHRGTSRLHIGASEEILAVEPEPADVLGMDLRAAVGGHLTGLVAILQDTFGEMVSSDLRVRPGGVEDRTLVYESDRGRTTIRAIQGPAEPGPGDRRACWHLAARADRGARADR